MVRSGFHLELVHGLAGSGVHKMIAGIGRHVLHLLPIDLGFARAYLLRRTERYAEKHARKRWIMRTGDAAERRF